MNRSLWPKQVAIELHNRVGLSHELVNMPDPDVPNVVTTAGLKLHYLLQELVPEFNIAESLVYFQKGK